MSPSVDDLFGWSHYTMWEEGGLVPRFPKRLRVRVIARDHSLALIWFPRLCLSMVMTLFLSGTYGPPLSSHCCAQNLYISEEQRHFTVTTPEPVLFRPEKGLEKLVDSSLCNMYFSGTHGPQFSTPL